jgi:surfeit locus 1 family protein
MGSLRSGLVLVATVLGVASTVSLGRWQLSRANQKIAIHETMMARQALQPLDNAALPCLDADWALAEQRPVHLRGTWLPQHTVYLDNRAMDGRAGFVVLTPLRLTAAMAPGTGQAPCEATTVLVQRGWVPRHMSDRTLLPALNMPSGEVVLPGRVVAAPSKMMALGADAEPAGRIRQNVDLAELSLQWGLRLRPGSIQQLKPEVLAQAGGDQASASASPSASAGQMATAAPLPGQDADGLLRHWWQPSADVGKHQAYAAQWFAMAAVMAALYLWFQWLKPLRARGLRSA